MTEPRPTDHKASPVPHKAAEKAKPHTKPHPVAKAPAPAPVAIPAPSSVPAKGLAVLSIASGLIGAAVFGLVRKGRR